MQISATHAYGPKLPTVAELNQLAGDFWSRLFADQGSISAINAAVQQEYRQQIRNLHEQAATGSFQESPLHHTETFWPLLVRPIDVTLSPIRYGDGYQYGGAHGGQPIYYGQYVEDHWRMPIPGDLVSATGVSDKVAMPDRWYTTGLDAFWRPGELEMTVDPREVFQTRRDTQGEPYLLLWLYMAKFERFYLANRFGTLLGSYQKSTEPYRSAITACMLSNIYGSNEIRLRELLAAAVGEPVAEKAETVVTLLEDRPSPVVITDRRTVYGRPGKHPVVSVGQVLEAGDFFFDSVKFSDFRSGVPDWLSSITLPKAVTGVAEAEIPAGTVPISVSLKNDKTYIRTGVDYPEFWDWINSAEPSLPAILAEHLGLKVSNRNTPSPEVFPASADVLSALAESSLRYSLSVSLLRSSTLVDGAAQTLGMIRQLLPPWVAHVVQFDGPPPAGWQTHGEQSIGTRL